MIKPFIALFVFQVLVFTAIVLFVTYSLNNPTPSVFSASVVKADPYTICVRDGDVLQYTIGVSYPDATQDNVVVILFFKNLFIERGEKAALVGQVKNNVDHVVRASPWMATIPAKLDIKAMLVQPYDWPDGDYILRDSAVNIGAREGTSSYDVYFTNQCEK